MLIREDGTFEKRYLLDLEDASARALRAVFGEAYDTRNGNPIVDLLKAFGNLGVVAQEDEMEDVYLGTTLRGARGPRLDALGKLIGGGQRRAAASSEGIVEITLTTALAAPTPLFAVGDIYFVDAEGHEFDLLEDVLPNSTTVVEANLRSRGTGFVNNIGPSTIVGVRFRTTAVETFWDNNVAGSGSSFTNPAAFTGGADEQSDAEYVVDLEEEDASNRSGSPAGIEQAIIDFGGVDFVRVYENTDPYDATDDFKALATGPSTSLSETLDAAGTTTRIAVKFPITTEAHRRFIQYFNGLFDHVSGTPTFTVRIETDNAGSPSGSLLRPRYELTGWTPTDDIVTGGTFLRGDYPCDSDDMPVTAWLVFTITAGSTRLKGGTAGSAGDVKVYTSGSWANSSINQAAAEVIGGIPPGGILAVCIGGTDDEIAQAINDWRPSGIAVTGSQPGTAVQGGENVTVPHEDGTQVQLQVTIALQVTGMYQGGTDAVKDVLIRYVGGVETSGEDAAGLNIGEAFIHRACVARFFDSREIVGVFDVTSLTVARLAGVESEQNLTPTKVEQFRLQAANINVTISDA